MNGVNVNKLAGVVKFAFGKLTENANNTEVRAISTTHILC